MLSVNGVEEVEGYMSCAFVNSTRMLPERQHFSGEDRESEGNTRRCRLSMRF